MRPHGLPVEVGGGAPDVDDDFLRSVFIRGVLPFLGTMFVRESCRVEGSADDVIGLQRPNVRLLNWDDFQGISIDCWFEKFMAPTLREEADWLDLGDSMCGVATWQ